MKRNAQGPDVEASERCAALSVSIPRSQFLYPSISEKVGGGGGVKRKSASNMKGPGPRSWEAGAAELGGQSAGRRMLCRPRCWRGLGPQRRERKALEEEEWAELMGGLHPSPSAPRWTHRYLHTQPDRYTHLSPPRGKTGRRREGPCPNPGVRPTECAHSWASAPSQHRSERRRTGGGATGWDSA